MAKYKKGQQVKINSEGKQNESYEKYFDMPLIITHVATNTKQHRGYDDGLNSSDTKPEDRVGLYDLKTLQDETLPFSLYDWEIEE